MADKESNSMATARYIIGVGSVVGLLIASGLLVRCLPGLNTVREPLVLCLLLGGPIGYAVLAGLCLRRWKVLEDREGAGSGRVYLSTSLVVGVVGTWATHVALPISPKLIAEVLFMTFGFWILGGFALVWVGRKLQMIMREANVSVITIVEGIGFTIIEGIGHSVLRRSISNADDSSQKSSCCSSFGA